MSRARRVVKTVSTLRSANVNNLGSLVFSATITMRRRCCGMPNLTVSVRITWHSYPKSFHAASKIERLLSFSPFSRSISVTFSKTTTSGRNFFIRSVSAQNVSDDPPGVGCLLLKQLPFRRPEFSFERSMHDDGQNNQWNGSTAHCLGIFLLPSMS